MRNAVLALTLILGTTPALAGGFSMDLPHLTWPTDDDVTVSTSDCDQAVLSPKAKVPKGQ